MSWKAYEPQYYAIRRILWGHQQGRCLACSCEMTKKHKQQDPRAVSVDHMLPKALGPRKGLENKVLMCLSCNAQKGDNPPSSELCSKHVALLHLLVTSGDLSMDKARDQLERYRALHKEHRP